MLFLVSCPSCKKANDGARPVRRSYLYTVTFWVEVHVKKFTCRKHLFSWRLLHTFNIVFKKCVSPCDFWLPAAKSWRRA